MVPVVLNLVVEDAPFYKIDLSCYFKVLSNTLKYFEVCLWYKCTKDELTFSGGHHTKCMVIAIFRMQKWTCMVGAATLDSIFNQNPSGPTEGRPMPVLTPSLGVPS